jgi:phosphoribosyl-ATP pyrophosphohydrolase
MTIDAGYLRHLYDVVQARRSASPDESYVAKMFARGRNKMTQKVGEEATEVVIAALAEGNKATVNESADLLFHLLVLWAEMGITVEEIFEEMQRRETQSGLDEKKSRKL